MLRNQQGRPLALQAPNPLMAPQAPRAGWTGGHEENFDQLGELYVVRGSPRHAQDIESFIAMEQAQEEAPKKVAERPRAAPVEERIELPLSSEPEGDEEMLKNPDGSPYLPSGNANNYDLVNPDHDLMDSVDQEQIELSGAPIEYYRVLVDARVDPLYNEQRQKVFLQEPVRMKAVFEPVPPVWNDIQVGFSSDETMMFSFNRKDFLERVGEKPRIGSLIRTCDEGIYWEIVNDKVNVQGEDRKMWGKHRFLVTCVKYQSTVTDSSPSMQGRESHARGTNPINIR